VQHCTQYSNSHCFQNFTWKGWAYHLLYIEDVHNFVLLCVTVTLVRLGDCWKKMRRCTASLLGMTRVMNIPAVIQVCCIVWKPCQALAGFSKDPYTKLNLKPNGRHLKRSVSHADGTQASQCSYNWRTEKNNTKIPIYYSN
jgi:hypothetical protein